MLSLATISNARRNDGDNHMAQAIALGVRIDPKLKKILDKDCQTRGLIMSRIVEDALIDKLEELEDLEDLPKLRKERSRPLSEVLKELGIGGKL